MPLESSGPRSPPSSQHHTLSAENSQTDEVVSLSAAMTSDYGANQVVQQAREENTEDGEEVEEEEVEKEEEDETEVLDPDNATAQVASLVPSSSAGRSYSGSNESDDVLSCDLGSLYGHVSRFYSQLLCAAGADPSDYYTPMVAVQFASFVLICFGWTAFSDYGLPPTSTADLFQANTVPLKLLFFMVAQFVIIIVDRVLYLWRLLWWKFALHILLVLVVHVAVFFVVPITTHRAFGSNPLLILFYLLQVFIFTIVKCSYIYKYIYIYICLLLALAFSRSFLLFFLFLFLTLFLPSRWCTSPSLLPRFLTPTPCLSLETLLRAVLHSLAISSLLYTRPFLFFQSCELWLAGVVQTPRLVCQVRWRCFVR